MSNMKSLKRTHLNAAELECVAIISEECGETVQAAQKLVRFGVNPYYDNWTSFEKEAGEILAALSFAIRSGRMSGTKVFEACKRKLNDYETMLINQEEDFQKYLVPAFIPADDNIVEEEPLKPNKKDATFSYVISKRGPIDYIDNGKDFLVSLGHHDYMSIWSMDIADLEILVNICKSITRPEDQDFVRKVKDAYHERTLNS